jgi:hypothetical protein
MHKHLSLSCATQKSCEYVNNFEKIFKTNISLNKFKIDICMHALHLM